MYCKGYQCSEAPHQGPDEQRETEDADEVADCAKEWGDRETTIFRVPFLVILYGTETNNKHL